MAAKHIPQKILLLACGSFNPITNSHLRMFELARDFLHKEGMYEVVGGIISPTNDLYKKEGLMLGKHRVEMIKLATLSSNWVKCSSWEVEQSQWTETAKVLVQIQNMISTRELENVDKDVKVKLLCGGDLLESFAVPKLWADKDIESIVGKFGIIVITRAGSCPEQFIENHHLLTKLKDNIQIVEEWVPNEISATKLRLALSRGESIKYLTPDPVIDYIKKHELYFSKK